VRRQNLADNPKTWLKTEGEGPGWISIARY